MEHKILGIFWLTLILSGTSLPTSATDRLSPSSTAYVNQYNTHRGTSLNQVPQDRNEAWRADLDILIKLLREKHWHYRDAPFPTAFEQRASDLRRRIPQLTDEQLVVEFQALLATLHDGHTLVYPFGMKLGSLSHIPIAFYDFEDGLAVIAADPTHTSMIGKKVLTVGGLPVAKLLEQATPLMSLENDSQRRWVYPTYLTFPAFLQAAGVKLAEKNVEVSIETDAHPQTVTLIPDAPPINPDKLVLGLIPPPAASGVPAPMFLSRLQDAYWFTTLADGSVVYLQMNRIANSKDEPLDRFSSRLQQSLLRPQTRALIVDLRNNNGGNGALLPPLVRSIITFRGLNPTAPIYVLIGRQTFSAAQTLVNRLEEYVDPVFVGEATGSKPNRFGNGSPFQLPYSGLLGEISSGYNQAATSRDTRTSTAPAISVGMKVKDWLEGRDVVLERVQSLLKQ